MKRLSPLDNFMLKAAAMAERLRRLTRNQMGSSRMGSNPLRAIAILTTRQTQPSLESKFNLFLIFCFHQIC